MFCKREYYLKSVLQEHNKCFIIYALSDQYDKPSGKWFILFAAHRQREGEKVSGDISFPAKVSTKIIGEIEEGFACALRYIAQSMHADSIRSPIESTASPRPRLCGDSHSCLREFLDTEVRRGSKKIHVRNS